MDNDEEGRDDDEEDDEEELEDDSGIAITIPMLGWDLDMANWNQQLNKTSPAQHTLIIIIMV